LGARLNDRAARPAANKAKVKLTMTIRTLEDITLIPTPVRVSKWTNDGRVEVTEQQMQAKLFTDLKGKKITLVCAAAMMGEPFSEVGRLSWAHVGPGGSRSPGVLSVGLIRKGKRNPIGFCKEFPNDNVILMQGAYALDFRSIGFPPCTTPLRWHCPSFGTVWTMVSAHCREIAGSDVLLDSTAASVKSHRDRHPERYAETVTD
jgi:hypothetical protein